MTDLSDRDKEDFPFLAEPEDWEPKWDSDETTGKRMREEWGSRSGLLSAGGTGLGVALDRKMRQDFALLLGMQVLADRHKYELNQWLEAYYRGDYGQPV